MPETDQPAVLPMTQAEMKSLGWDELDVLLVTGDAYVDHPAFGTALIGRCLVARGYRVGVVAQPRWDSLEDITRLGRPRLFAGVSAGALDSMLAHYTAFRKKRHDDAYTPGGRHGARPNRACIVYTGLVRQAFPGLPVVLGGIEASLRRATHYDFWSDSLRKSILLDSKADLLVYGMAERAVIEVARRLAGKSTEGRASLHGISGTVFAPRKAEPWRELLGDAALHELPSHEDIQAFAPRLVEATLAFERQAHHGGEWLVQRCGGREVVFAPPAEPLAADELDALYELPFTRAPHPSYREPIPAVEMIQFSMTSHRGCAGGCSFCSLALHQGRRIQSRSVPSLKREVARLTRHPAWHGAISDVGGPTANMWGARCDGDPKRCHRPSCLAPEICPKFRDAQGELAAMLRELAHAPGVKHLRVASGLRHDLALRDPDYVRAIIAEFVGGQLKLAPEHCVERVLRLMRKPRFAQFERLLEIFDKGSAGTGKDQFVIPYLLSAFPGCTDADMRDLAGWLRRRKWRPQQVQCFIPTPGTVAAAMYYAAIDPDGAPIHVAKTDAERLRQHRILLGQRGPADANWRAPAHSRPARNR